jgi:two-component system phosphate regulon sensor histidine kinase PhoR
LLKLLHSRIFRRFFLGTVLVLAGTLFTLDLYVTHYTPLRQPGGGASPIASAVYHGLWEVSILGILMALAIAYLVSRPLISRLARLQGFAEELVKSPSPDPTLAERDDELGALGRSLNQTAVELSRLVDRLSTEAARREAILASMVEGVLAVDNELQVTFCNGAFLRAVRYEGTAPERRPLLEVVRDPSLLDVLTRVMATGESVKARIQLAGLDGRSFEVQAAPLAASHRPGTIAILHDITDLERLERVRTDFVANVSHELRTPLAAIRGFAETLLEGALEDKDHNRQFLEVIKNHAIRLNNVAADLLALTELESKAELPTSESFLLLESLNSALAAVEPEARARNVSVRCDGGEGFMLMGDRHRFEQALVNLLYNGIKFNRSGGEVQVNAGRTADGRIRVAVTDTGIGIPSQDLDRIFERFYRVDKARSREVGGTGLGLSIVKHIIERMGGRISVESQLGQGSTFTLLLPSGEAPSRS